MDIKHLQRVLRVLLKMYMINFLFNFLSNVWAFQLSQSSFAHSDFFPSPEIAKITKKSMCPKCVSNDIRMYEETNIGMVYTLFICN